eukprot:GHVU01152178.1.p1 GENE.GHVU01152178.1~~GHVU01152178.1.p1  ORF type:complete len:325 (+),score=49.67 GHVU01152178.1:56-1030(+)
MASINQAHLIHDHSTGRSSTRLHAPPGGQSSMGTSFGWDTAEPVAPERRGRAGAGGNGHGESPIKMAQQAFSPPPPAMQQPTGFGDTGSSSIRMSGARGNAMGSSYGWDVPQGQTPSRSSPPSRNLEPRSNVQTASSSKLGVGTSVVYKQMGKAGTESLAVIVDIEPVGSRKDNYRIRFEDGRERNTSEDKLTATSGGVGDMTQGMGQMHFEQESTAQMRYEQENMPPRGYTDANLAGAYSDSLLTGKGAQETHNLRAVEGAGIGELQIGQRMMYRQTARSEPEECTVLAVELPSANGHMRTKTFYQIKFQDGRTRETTIDKLF